MSRDMTLAEIERRCMVSAADAYSRRAIFNHDLNQYSTPGARSDWQKGFDGIGMQMWPYCLAYQLGKQVKALDLLLSAEPLGSFT